jgi:Reverse transcriptase (RNA-dependent DNA polymerase)
MERLVLFQLRPHLLASKNFNPLQSGFRPAHSTETALLRILDSCYSAMDNKRQTALISLDISAAFDTINHCVLLERLRSDFGVDGVALDWLRAILFTRSSAIRENWQSLLSYGSMWFRSSTGLCARAAPICSLRVAGGRPYLQPRC